jgi:hypothetical protein
MSTSVVAASPDNSIGVEVGSDSGTRAGVGMIWPWRTISSDSALAIAHVPLIAASPP